ncbi:uncharacterized protein LOC132262787 [Phlebotomus argentipes]|uniref:uncharacterized protein LOC132262787 n=1 Tax=Phlebotomus argentipes TaxID=94469 RepID=UPI00289314B7|nr:uncharacterized protein LOC132262787 [Phlebotomus argentipes]
MQLPLPRSIVNGAGVRLNAGKTVGVMVRVKEYDGSSLFMQGTTSDNVEINITLRTPLDRRINEQWVEVIGTPTRPDSINAGEVIMFPDDGQEFDKRAHNMMIQFLTNASNVFNIR